MPGIPPNVHDAINGAIRREVPRAVHANLEVIAKAVSEHINLKHTNLPAYEAQATNITTTAVPQFSTIPYNTLVLDTAGGEVFRNPDGSFTVARGVWEVAWGVPTATTAGLMVDNVLVSQGVEGETDLIEIVNKTATVKVIAATGAVTLQDSPATQASITFVRLASPRHKECKE